MTRAVLIGPTYPYRGGIAHYTTFLYNALQRIGVDLLLVSFSRQYPRWAFPGVSDKDNSAKPLQVEGTNYWLDSLNPLTWITTFLRIKRFLPERLILQWWTSYWSPVWLTLLRLNSIFLHCPVTFICHNVVPHDARAGELWVAKQVLRHAERCVVHTETEKLRLKQLLPTMPISVVQMPPFYVFDQYRISSMDARHQLGLPIDQPIILFFGIVRPYKGLEDLIRAMPSVLAEAPKALLVIAGEFWDERAQYENHIADLGIGDMVRIDDRYIPDEEVGLYFSAADLLALPYRRASGSAALQAANSFGIPIVATETVHAENGLDALRVDWAPACDPAALAAAITARLKAPYDPRPPHPNSSSDDSAISWQEVAKAVMQ